jgi:hypothetical protein
MHKKEQVVTWIRLGKQFINQDNIRSIKREGKRTRISLIIGSDIMVEEDYDKVKDLLPGSK